jgi:chromosome segregation ATPase
MLNPSLSAQIYKYVDDSGQKRWTDDLSQVPIGQRESAQRIEDAGDMLPDASTDQMQGDPAAALAADAPEDRVELTRESLMKEKSDLENQYQLLIEERSQLERMKSQKGDAAHLAELTKRITDYNAKTKQYEAQLAAYKERIEAYKKKIMTAHDTPTQ